MRAASPSRFSILAGMPLSRIEMRYWPCTHIPIFVLSDAQQSNEHHFAPEDRTCIVRSISLFGDNL
jgi:hypothetical protein